MRIRRKDFWIKLFCIRGLVVRIFGSYFVYDLIF
nr:MAG TPA: hypothetical protein [Caudoviricetes sp.]